VKKTKYNIKNVPARDSCQTPPYALIPLLKYINPALTVWECASGEGLMAEAIRLNGNNVIATTLEEGFDFFKTDVKADCIITNPPYSIKYKWMERCYELGRPFALLLPVDTIAAVSSHKLWKKYGVSIILLSKRINFKMPNMGWDGQGADYSVEWFTFGLGLPEGLIYEEVPNPKNLPQWMVRPNNIQDITVGGKSGN
jgi:hypothetical protein